MSKKLVYFKNVPHHASDLSCKQLSLIEAASFLSNLEVIPNVFQLFQFDDLKLLISKNNILQKLLTSNLPQQDHHGYLWQGENLPDIENLLQKSSSISTCIIFQKNSEPKPDVLRSSFSRLLQTLEIYNWVIYVLPAYNHIRHYLQSHSKWIQTEIDTDRYCRELWRNFEIGRNRGGIFEIERPRRINATNQNWQTLLLNILCAENPNPVFISSTGDGSIIKEAVIYANKVVVTAQTSLDKAILKEKSTIHHFDPAHYNHAISILNSQIRLLQTANSNHQKDLFTDDAEQRFIKLWEKERNRYQEEKMKWISIDLFKFLIITRFLIEQQLISREQEINDFIYSVLLQWADQIVRKKRNVDPAANFLEFIRNRYLEYYMFARIRELAPHYPEQPLQFLPKTCREAGIKFGAILLNAENHTDIVQNRFKLNQIFYPEKIVEDIPKTENISSEDDAEKSKWLHMIRRQDEKYLLLGNYGRAVITRLMASLQQSEAARCLEYWANIIEKFYNNGRCLAQGGKIGLILRPFSIQNLSGPEEIQIQKVIIEMLKNHADLKKYNIQNEFRVDFTNIFKHKNQRIVMIMEKA